MGVGRESASAQRERFEQVSTSTSARYRPTRSGVPGTPTRRKPLRRHSSSRGAVWLTCRATAKPWPLGVTPRVLANQRRAAGRREALRARVTEERESDSEPGRRPPIIQGLGQLEQLSLLARGSVEPS